MSGTNQVDHNSIVGASSVIGDGSGLTIWANTFGLDPKLVGGVYYRLLPGSPAIDAGAAVAVATDYYGTARPQGAAIDIGASEFVVASLPSPIPGPTLSGITVDQITPTSFRVSWVSNGVKTSQVVSIQ